MQPAVARLRIFSYLVDYAAGLAALLPAGVGYIISLVTHQFSLVPIVLSSISGLLLLSYLIVLLSMSSRLGSSPGKSAMRLRAIRIDTFAAPGASRTLVAALVFFLSHLIPLIGPVVVLLSCLFDKKQHRGWLQKASGTHVLDLRSGIDPTNPRVLARAEYLLSRPHRDVSEHLPSLGTTPDASELDDPVLKARPRSTSGIIGAANSDWHQRPKTAPGVIRRAAFAFDDGSYIPVPDSGLLGRAPAATPEGQGELLIALKDPERLLSKTHLAFGCDGENVWVMDLGSSNGTQVTVISGAPYNIAAQTRVHLNDGDVVQVGSRTFRITFQEQAQ